MATGKKKIVVYADWKASFDALTDEEAGMLIKHFFAYVNDENPVTDNRIVNLMFEPIKATLKRDLEKWESTRNQRIEAGAKGGKQKVANAKKVKQNVANVAVSDSVSVSVNVKDNIYRAFAHLSLSIEDFNKLEVDYYKHQIDNALDAIENFKNNRKYKSLYLTAKNWLSKEPKKHDLKQPIKDKLVLEAERQMKLYGINK